MDFAALPPEINSASIYAGPGSGPMMAAAAAWDDLAAELHWTAASYASVISGLTSGPWLGPASVSMMAAATPYVAWMSATARQAAHAGAQAKAAAAAYEAAFAMTVPPPVIAANRALLMMLVATNILGQNTPAIMDTEACYAEMWAQDAAAMYGYAAASAAATRLTPFTSPPHTTTPAGLAGQAAAVARASGGLPGTHAPTIMLRGSQIISAVPQALGRLSLTPGPLYDLIEFLADVSAFVVMSAQVLATCMGTIGSINGVINGAAHAASAPAMAAIGGLSSGMGALGSAGLGAGAVSAGLGRAAAIGSLSVPPSWAPPALPASPLASALGSKPFIAPPGSAAPGMLGMPLTGLGANANGNGNGVLKYGFRPTVIARSPVGG
ncbi:hypothetical protein A5641_10445 [Mycobacterium sp. 1554424.7]|nr:hypothetical protein A5641_10445 [Mycobacterium sp. 1554424.7]